MLALQISVLSFPHQLVVIVFVTVSLKCCYPYLICIHCCNDPDTLCIAVILEWKVGRRKGATRSLKIRATCLHWKRNWNFKHRYTPCVKITVIKYLSVDAKFKIAQLWQHWNAYYDTLMLYIEIRVLAAFWNLKTWEFVHELKTSYK